MRVHLKVDARNILIIVHENPDLNHHERFITASPVLSKDDPKPKSLSGTLGWATRLGLGLERLSNNLTWQV